MAFTVRHQVFVSSTFTDLIEERAEVIQAIWEMDCIPTGMEAFVASNESQWEVIKRVIDECDYYVLIIGGRYGSVTDDGISYTEKEYRYAQDLGIPVLAFVHSDPEQIPAGKTEKDEKLRQKLEAFRAGVMTQYPVKSWSSPTELGGHVSRALIREIKTNPRPGWIRNDESSPVALLEQVTRLTKENSALRESIAAVDQVEVDPSLERGDDEIELWGERQVAPQQSKWNSVPQGWHVLASWDDIFRDIGPALINEATEGQLKDILARFHGLDEVEEGYVTADPVAVAPEVWNEVLIQFRALGYLDKGEKKRGVNDRNSYWRITPLGDRHLVNLLARKRKPAES